MEKINVFEPHIARDFDVFFQKDATLETKVDVWYLQYSVDEIDKYITQTVKPELDGYVAEEKSKLISYHLNLNDNILSLEGTDVITSTVDLGELSYGDKYVTLLGAQNIDSVKTFTQNPVISKNEAPALEVQNTSTLLGSAPLEDQISSLNFTDATGTILGSVQHKVCDDAGVVSSLNCSNLEASESSEIAIGYDENGDVYTSAPTPANGDNSTKIATTAFVEQIKQNLQGEITLKEDIISDLTTIRTGATLGATAVQPADLAIVAVSGSYNDLSNRPTIPTVNNATLTIQKNGTNVTTFTANASSNVTANIIVPTDTNELANGAGFITGISSGDVITALGYTPANNANVVNTSENQTIAGNKTFSGNLSATTQANTDNSTKVATTAFVKSVLSTSGAGLAEISKSGDGYCKFTNGLIIQWGKAASATDRTVTLPTAFTADTYRVAANTQVDGGQNNAVGIISRTTTSFHIRAYGGTANYDTLWIAVGY